MASTPRLAAAVLLVLALSALPGSWAQSQTLSLQLFNDSACTVVLPVANLNPAVPVGGIGACLPAPPSLQQVGYSSYSAGCGLANNNTVLTSIGTLWSSSVNNASACPGTNSLTTFFTVNDYNVANHTATTCLGPISVRTTANFSTLVSAVTAYAQFTCGTSAPNAARLAGHTDLVTAIAMIVMLLAYGVM